jgi:DNA-binding NarL/FixJ family response regulator
LRTILVCVRTPVAAQAVVSAAVRLGMAPAVRTAVTMVEAIARLSEEPADLVLADPSIARPDSAEFARRLLAVAPSATVVFFGSEDPRSSAAAIAAGARAVIRVDVTDPVTTLAKAVLLVLSQLGRANGDALPARVSGPPVQGGPGGVGMPAGRAVAGREAGRTGAGAPMVPGAVPGARISPAGHAVPQQRGDLAAEPPRRRVELTERELQVLRGMADGKSNAEIGRELFVSEDTVKTHARRLFRKLGARDRAHAVAAAFRAGLVS